MKNLFIIVFSCLLFLSCNEDDNRSLTGTSWLYENIEMKGNTTTKEAYTISFSSSHYTYTYIHETYIDGVLDERNSSTPDVLIGNYLYEFPALILDYQGDKIAGLLNESENRLSLYLDGAGTSTTLYLIE